MTDRRLVLASLALVIATLAWAGNGVVGRAVIDMIPPMALSFWRWIIAFVLIAPFSIPWLREAWPTLRANVGKLFILAVLSAGLYNTILYLAAHTTTAINISLVGATMPIVVGLVAYLIQGTRMRPRQILGLLVGIPGVITIITQGRLSVVLTLEFSLGDLLMLIAVSGWGMYTVLLQRYRLRLHPVVLLTAIIALALPVALALYALEWAILQQPFTLDRPVVLALLYVGVFPSIVAYLGWNYGVSVMGASRAAMFIYLLPVFGAVLSIVLLGEQFQGFHAVGAALILAGLYFATTARES